ncbi:MAG: hypothetical protein P4M14_09975 [Gammaproteobacteria bacterium]|nr:hypothetical protein [Gammaproteobacteria bacterium]
MRNYYQVLEIDASATEDEVRAVYKKKMMVTANISLDALQLFSFAAQTLLDPALRAVHDIYAIAEEQAQKGFLRHAIALLEEKITVKNDEYRLQISTYLTRLNLFSRGFSVLREVEKKEDEYWEKVAECYVAVGERHSKHLEWPGAISAYQSALSSLEKKQHKTPNNFQSLFDMCRNLVYLHYANNDDEAGIYFKMIEYETKLKEYKDKKCGSVFFSPPPRKYVPPELPGEKSTCIIS